MSDVVVRRANPGFVLGGLSLVPVMAGAVICELSSVPASVWGRNLAAWAAGGLAALLLQRAGRWLFPAMLFAAAVLLGLTLVGPDQLGVHRWLNAGPISLNVAMLMLPAALVAIVAVGQRSGWPWIVALALMAILVGQPDRSQATAFGIGLVWAVFRSRQSKQLRFAVAVAAALMAIGAWFRLDSLLPVPEVEEILTLAYAASPGLAAVAFVSLLLFSLAPLWSMRGAHIPRQAGETLSLYFVISACMPFVGAYPVPLIGVGASPILGAWLAAAALSRLPPANEAGSGRLRADI